MSNLTVDPLAIAALAGFGVLVLMTLGITVWFVRQAGKSAGDK